MGWSKRLIALPALVAALGGCLTGVQRITESPVVSWNAETLLYASFQRHLRPDKTTLSFTTLDTLGGNPAYQPPSPWALGFTLPNARSKIQNALSITRGREVLRIVDMLWSLRQAVLQRYLDYCEAEAVAPQAYRLAALNANHSILQDLGSVNPIEDLQMLALESGISTELLLAARINCPSLSGLPRSPLQELDGWEAAAMGLRSEILESMLDTAAAMQQYNRATEPAGLKLDASFSFPLFEPNPLRRTRLAHSSAMLLANLAAASTDIRQSSNEYTASHNRYRAACDVLRRVTREAELAGHVAGDIEKIVAAELKTVGAYYHARKLLLRFETVSRQIISYRLRTAKTAHTGPPNRSRLEYRTAFW